MSNIFDMEVRVGTFQERTLIGALVADLAIYVPYVLQSARTNTLGRIAGTLFALIVAQVVVQTVIAVATRDRRQDERDVLIGCAGTGRGMSRLPASL